MRILYVISQKADCLCVFGVIENKAYILKQKNSDTLDIGSSEICHNIAWIKCQRLLLVEVVYFILEKKSVGLYFMTLKTNIR